MMEAGCLTESDVHLPHTQYFSSSVVSHSSSLLPRIHIALETICDGSGCGSITQLKWLLFIFSIKLFFSVRVPAFLPASYSLIFFSIFFYGGFPDTILFTGFFVVLFFPDLTAFIAFNVLLWGKPFHLVSVQ